jgi:hypothetical protein
MRKPGDNRGSGRSDKDPRIRALAKVATNKIKQLTEEHNEQIEAIYREFQEKAAAIKAVAKTTTAFSQTSADSLPRSSAGVPPKQTK